MSATYVRELLAKTPTTLPVVTVDISTPTALSASPTSARKGVLVQADSANTASVFVGGSDVTTSTGMEITKGDSLPFQTEDAAGLFAIAAVAGQKLRVLVL